MRKELWLFVVATIALFGGTLGELVNPYYIGMFVDNIIAGDFPHVYTLCWQLACIVFVSFIPNHLISGTINLRIRKRIPLQPNK
jgi:hypothetical protein